MNETERNKLDGAILKAAKPYEAFVDAVLAHAKDSFRRGAKQVRIVFYEEGAMSISDDGRELTEKQFLAMTSLRKNKLRSAYERLGLAFVPHAAWFEVFSGSRTNLTRLPSTENFCQMSIRPNRTGNVTVMFHEMGGGGVATVQGRHVGTVLRLLPAMLRPTQAPRVTVVDKHGKEWNLGKGINLDVLAERTIALPESFGEVHTIFRKDPLMLVVDRLRVPMRQVLDNRRPHWNAAKIASFAPLGSPWLTGTIGVSRKDGGTEFQAVAGDFPPESYADGTVDAILDEIDRTNAAICAMATIARIADAIHKRVLERPFLLNGVEFSIARPEPYGSGTRSVWLGVFDHDTKATQIKFDPMHPVFQADAQPDAIHERLLWCITNLMRADRPAQDFYLELRAAIDAARKS